MEEDTVLWTKFEARRSIRDLLRAVPGTLLQEWSAAVASQLQSKTDLWDRPGVISLFGGLRAEPDLISFFIPWLRDAGWRTVLFAIRDTHLVPYEVKTSADLERGALGAWEPVPRAAHEVNPADIGIVLVPGLAFDAADGTRLGRGKGYYDRLLGEQAPMARRIGVGFEMQVIPNVPREPHDSRVRELVTETGWRTFT